MATRIFRWISVISGTLPLGREAGGGGWRGAGPRRAAGPGAPGRGDLRLLRRDEVVQPPDVALGGGELVVHQRHRVTVDALLVALERLLDHRPAALEVSPPALEEPDA